MASGTTRPSGSQWVFFSAGGKRHTLRLGNVGLAARQEVERRIDRLTAQRGAGLPLDIDLRQWLASLDRRTHAMLARCGLTEARSDQTVQELFAWHAEHLTSHNKARGTLKVFQRVEANCLACWGADRLIVDLKPIDADALQAWMLARGKSGKPLASTTTSRRVAMARQVFDAAKSRGWLTANPFSHIRRRGESNPDRDEYVTWDDAERLIEAETTAEFRLLLALARMCGLRCPSELAPLPWSAVDWDLNIFNVEAPKTRSRGKPRRDIPIFRGLAPYFREAFDAAPERSDLMFPNFQGSSTAITNRLERLCRKCRIAMWPKPWMNMRASAERDMLKGLPLDEAAAFLGHSPETALRHYSRVFKDLRAQAQGRALRLPDLTWEVKQKANTSHAFAE